MATTQGIDTPEGTTGRVVGIIMGIVTVFALVAWGVVSIISGGANETSYTVQVNCDDTITCALASSSERYQFLRDTKKSWCAAHTPAQLTLEEYQDCAELLSDN